MKTDTYASGWTPVYTFFHRDEFDSGLEARAAMTMYFLDISYTHNTKAWLFPDSSVPQYKPDFTWTASTGEIVVMEVKGYFDKRSLAQREEMKKLVDDPNDPVIALISATREEMMIYQNGEELPAAFYKCPSCGKGYIAANAHHECPRCGEEDAKFICVDFNTWANEESARRRKKAVEDFEMKLAEHNTERAANKAMTMKLKKRVEKLAKDECMLLENTIGILSPFARGHAGEIRPDYNYNEAPTWRTYFGTAYAPFAVVYVSAKPSDLEKKHYEELKNYVSDRMAPLVKAVIITASGIHVCDDKQKSPEYKPGSLYSCDKCGASYFARDDEYTCPCCDSKKTRKVSK